MSNNSYTPNGRGYSPNIDHIPTPTINDGDELTISVQQFERGNQGGSVDLGVIKRKVRVVAQWFGMHNGCATGPLARGTLMYAEYKGQKYCVRWYPWYDSKEDTEQWYISLPGTP